MEPILKRYFLNFKDSFEIETDNSPRKEAVAFEQFVNYVLFSRDDPDVFTANTELLDSVCVGGGNDTGIDGIGIKINDRLVRNIDEVREITDASKKINIEFIFIQAKMRPHFEVSEFNTFGTGVKVFFSEGYLPENDKISEFRKIKDYIYSDGRVISKLDENPSLYLYYIGTGIKPTNDNFSGAINWLTNELKNFYFENVVINTVGGKEIIKYCRELENKFEVQINIIDIFPLIVASNTDVKKSYTFTCSATEFLKILQKEDGSLRRSLFNDNVRDYLGNKGAINSEIEKTIIEDPEMFLLCNNGITIVCTDFEQIRDKLVKIENPQIVNGCQTSNSIFNNKSNENISKLQLIIRLISTENLNVSNKIVRGTNKQNQVLEEAFEATLPFHQEILEPFFIALNNSDTKIYYERRAKQYNNDPRIKKTQIVNLRILTQTFVSIFLNSPHDSHRHEAKLLEEFACDKDQRKIFKEDHSPFPYYICALTWYMFEKLFRESRIDKKYKPYKAHLYRIFRDCVGEFPPKLHRSKSIDNYCEKLLKILTGTQFENKVKKVLNVFDATQNLWTKRKSRYGMKDNREFTKLLIQQSRDNFVQNQELKEPIEEDSKTIYEGKILSITWKHGVWFSFIKRGIQYENIYFDSRSYNGEVRKIIPNAKVKFEIGYNNKGFFAKNVVLKN